MGTVIWNENRSRNAGLRGIGRVPGYLWESLRTEAELLLRTLSGGRLVLLIRSQVLSIQSSTASTIEWAPHGKPKTLTLSRIYEVWGR